MRRNNGIVEGKAPTVSEYLSSQGIDHTKVEIKSLLEEEMDAIITTQRPELTSYEQKLIKQFCYGIPQLLMLFLRLKTIASNKLSEFAKIYFSDYFPRYYQPDDHRALYQIIERFTGINPLSRGISDLHCGSIFSEIYSVVFQEEYPLKCLTSLDLYKDWITSGGNTKLLLYCPDISKDLAKLLQHDWDEKKQNGRQTANILPGGLNAPPKHYVCSGSKTFCSSEIGPGEINRIRNFQKEKLFSNTQHKGRKAEFICFLRQHEYSYHQLATVALQHERVFQNKGLPYFISFGCYEKAKNFRYDPESNEMIEVF